jgi:hypothetical protein
MYSVHLPDHPLTEAVHYFTAALVAAINIPLPPVARRKESATTLSAKPSADTGRHSAPATEDWRKIRSILY